MYALDDSVWGMKITALEESTYFATLDTEKLFSKLKSHELSRKGHPNHDASLTSKAFVSVTRLGVHVAKPTNTTVTPGFKAKPDAHRMYAQDQVVIHTVRM
jgi:hypothetical protein